MTIPDPVPRSLTAQPLRPPRSCVSLVLLASLCGGAGAVHASPTTLELGDEQDLALFQASAGPDGAAEIASGALLLSGWIRLALQDGAWLDRVRADKGWWMAWEVAPSSARDDCARVHVGDRRHSLTVRIRQNEIELRAGEASLVVAASTQGPHAYRLERSSGSPEVTLLVDGEELGRLALGEEEPEPPRLELRNACNDVRSAWLSLSYAAFARGAEEDDDDDDGVPNDLDLCPWTPTGLDDDSDRDGYGDTCDACPEDPDRSAAESECAAAPTGVAVPFVPGAAGVSSAVTGAAQTQGEALPATGGCAHARAPGGDGAAFAWLAVLLTLCPTRRWASRRSRPTDRR